METLGSRTTLVAGRMLIRLLALLFSAVWLLGTSFDIPSQCQNGVYLPPMPGTPQPNDQVIRMIPAVTTTYRMRYGTNPGNMATWSTGGSTGQEITADNRGEFAMSSLTADTQYHWQVECSEDSRWKPGWRGHVHTLPSTGGTIKIVVGTDAHYMPGLTAASGVEGGNAYVDRTYRGFALMVREHDANAYIDLGDTFHLHCRGGCDGLGSYTDDFARGLGSFSVTNDAQNSDEEDDFAEARYSLVLRRMWPFLRYVPQVWSRGNHDAGGGFGGNGITGAGGDSYHWQFRTRPWDVTTIDIDFATEFAEGTGIFTEAGHGMGDGDGPYRWANTAPGVAFTPPSDDNMTGCAGSRASTDADNEWYVDLSGLGDQVNTFKIALTAVAAGCTGGSGLVGDGTLLQGSDMQAASKAVIDKYLPQQNDVYAHSYGGATAQDHVMGPVPLSDYVLVLNVDEYDFSGLGSCASDPLRKPLSNRLEDCSWSLGTDQQAGVLALIAEIANGGGAYEDVETLIVLFHSGLGGFDSVGYAYARGSLCEVDTTCVSGGGNCWIDDNCAGADVCETQDCSADFAHPRMQELQTAMAAMVARTSGVALVLYGHDHMMAFGEKGTSGVYYLNAGQIGDQPSFGWRDEDDFRKRYDFDGDGIPAYQNPSGVLPAYDTFKERGTEYKGFSVLTLQPAAETDSGKTEVTVDYRINMKTSSIHGSSPPGFPFLLRGD